MLDLSLNQNNLKDNLELNKFANLHKINAFEFLINSCKTIIDRLLELVIFDNIILSNLLITFFVLYLLNKSFIQFCKLQKDKNKLNCYYILVNKLSNYNKN